MIADLLHTVIAYYNLGHGIVAGAAVILSVKSGLTLLTLGFLALAEYFFPAALPPARTRLTRWTRNLSLWALNIPLSIYVVLPLTGAAVGLAPSWRPDWLGGWRGVVLDLLILDVFIYFWHRANHEIPILWRFHRVHHYDRFLDTTTALRFHWGEVLLSAMMRGVIIIMTGIGFDSVVLYEGFLLCAALFQHSNLRLDPSTEAILSRIIVTPSIHWVHHHAMQEDTDSNYATGFSLWDRMFGTRSKTHRTPTMTIGVETVDHDSSLANLLIDPFSKK